MVICRHFVKIVFIVAHSCLIVILVDQIVVEVVCVVLVVVGLLTIVWFVSELDDRVVFVGIGGFVVVRIFVVVVVTSIITIHSCNEIIFTKNSSFAIMENKFWFDAILPCNLGNSVNHMVRNGDFGVLATSQNLLCRQVV